MEEEKKLILFYFALWCWELSPQYMSDKHSLGYTSSADFSVELTLPGNSYVTEPCVSSPAPHRIQYGGPFSVIPALGR